MARSVPRRCISSCETKKTQTLTTTTTRTTTTTQRRRTTTAQKTKHQCPRASSPIKLIAPIFAITYGDISIDVKIYGQNFTIKYRSVTKITTKSLIEHAP